MVSNKTLARVAGCLYLGVAVLGGFAEYVRTNATVVGDAAATASNVVGHATQFRLAFAFDLLDLPLFLAVGLILYVMLRPVNAPAALTMLVLNAVSVAVQGLNMLNHAGAVLVAMDPNFTTGLSAAASQAMVLLLLDLHRIGYLIGQIFFGLYLLPLGYLVFRSGYFPRVLGAVLAAGATGYVLGVVVSVASMGFDSTLATYFGLVGGLAELVFLAWLVIMGAGSGTAHDSAKGGAFRWTA